VQEWWPVGMAFIHACYVYVAAKKHHYSTDYSIAGDGKLSKFCVTDLVQFTADSEVELNICYYLRHMIQLCYKLADRVNGCTVVLLLSSAPRNPLSVL